MSKYLTISVTTQQSETFPEGAMHCADLDDVLGNLRARTEDVDPASIPTLTEPLRYTIQTEEDAPEPDAELSEMVAVRRNGVIVGYVLPQFQSEAARFASSV